MLQPWALERATTRAKSHKLLPWIMGNGLVRKRMAKLKKRVKIKVRRRVRIKRFSKRRIYNLPKPPPAPPKCVEQLLPPPPPVPKHYLLPTPPPPPRFGPVLRLAERLCRLPIPPPPPTPSLKKQRRRGI